jgi:hypothetical protein
MPKRKDTKLESEGAEFLVLGNLLVEGISCYKAYVNFPGFDLTAISSDAKRTAKIQVKSRWATNYDKGFPIKNFGCDFVVHVALNRGYSFGKKATKRDSGIKSPDFFVLPVDVVKKFRNRQDSWGKVYINRIPNIENYKNNWRLVREFLEN